MDKFFITIYRFFENRKKLMYGVLILSTLLFAYFGLKMQYEENIAKLLPQTQASVESGLAFNNLKVKDKVFVQLTGKNETLSPEVLATYCDEFIEQLLEKDSSTHSIDNVLYKLDDDLIINGLDYALTHVPSFVDASCYTRFDSLLTPAAIDAQMVANYELVMSDEEGNLTEMVSQDPIALRTALMPLSMDSGKGFGGYALIDGHLFVPDSTVALAFISPTFSAMDSQSGALLIESLEEEIETFTTLHPEIEILFHGSPVQGVFNARQIKSDLLFTIGLSLLIICLVISFCFKNKSTLLFLLAPVAYGTLFALACMYWIKGSMSLMAMGIGAIVLGVALSYSLHILTHSKYVSDPIQLLKDQSTPVCLGCLTTIGAFLGLLFTESDLLKDFGLFASFAMVGTTLFALIFLPHFFNLSTDKRSEKAFRLLDAINSYPFDKKRPLRITIEVVCIVCFFTAGWVTFDSNLRNIGYDEPKVLKSNKLYAAKNNQGFASQYYAAASEDLDEALKANAAMLHVLDSLKETGTIQQYSKVGNLFIPLEQQEERIARWKAYWTDERIAQVRKHITASARAHQLDPIMFEPFYMMLEADYEAESLYDADILPENLLCNFIEKTDGKFMVFTSVLLDKEQKMKVNDAVATCPHAVVIDPYYYTNDMIQMLHADFNTILGISSLFVFIVLLLSFRSLFCALVAFLPMSLSWYVVQGIMGIFGLQFNLINIIIATFIFGIGVDYSIFVMSGLIAKATGADERLLTYHKTAIFFSALVLMVVVGSLLFAVHPAIHSIGLSTLIGMSATILITYTLQPALFRYLMKFKFFAKRFEHEKR